MDNTAAILRTRAEQAAKKIVSDEGEKKINVVTFRVGDDVYALEADSISEVYPFAEPLPIPYTPPYIQGIIHLRGRFVSIVNLKLFFGIETQNDDLPRSILLLSDEGMEFALAVDEVLEETKLSPQALRIIPSDFNLPRPELIVGVSDEGIIVLSGKKLLGDSAMRVYQEVTTSYKGGENVQKF